MNGFLACVNIHIYAKLRQIRRPDSVFRVWSALVRRAGLFYVDTLTPSV